MNRVVAILLDRVMVWICGGALWTRALSWVALYEDRELSGAEKRERVVKGLQDELLAIGQDVTSSLIRLAIEAAVQSVRRRAA